MQNRFESRLRRYAEGAAFYYGVNKLKNLSQGLSQAFSSNKGKFNYKTKKYNKNLQLDPSTRQWLYNRYNKKLTYSKSRMPKRRRYSKRRSGYKRYRKGYNRTAGKYGRFTAPGPKGNDLKYIDLTSNVDLYTGVATNSSNTHLQTVLWSRADGGSGADPSLVQGIINGIGTNQRSNQKITIKSMQIIGTMRGTEQGTLNDSPQLGTIYVVLDKQCNGVSATPNSIWTPGVSGGSELANLKNLGNSQRFTVLRKFPVSLVPPYKDNMSMGSIIDYYHKCSIPIEYGTTTDTTGVITNVKSNNLMVFATVEGNHSFRLHVKIRLRYNDN